MSHEEESELLAEELRRALIAAGVKPHDLTPLPGQQERSQAALAGILNARGSEPVRVNRAGSRRWLRRAAGLVAAAVLASIVTVWTGHAPQPAQAATPPLLAFSNQERGRIPAVGEDAAPMFQVLAAEAARQPEPSDQPVQHVVLSSWWSSSGESADGQVHSLLEPVDRESFYEPDGTMRAIERRGAPLDREGDIRQSDTTGAVLSDETFVSSDPGPHFADSLPTDPEALRTELLSRQDPGTCRDVSGACLIGDVVGLFHKYVVPSALTAALWRVLATDPTITYLGPVRDRLGRPAEAFSTPGEDGVSQRLLLIAPGTGAYLGEEVVLIAPSPSFDFQPPAVTSFSALVHSERVAPDHPAELG